MRGLVVVLIVFCIGWTGLGAHANSVSYAEFSVDRSTIRAVVRLPLDDADLLLRLDRDLDGDVSASELARSQDAIHAYLAKHLHITADGAVLAETLDHVATWRDPSAFQYLEADISFHAAHDIGHLAMRSDLLTELYPSHKTLGRINAAGRDERFTLDSASSFDKRVAPDRRATIAVAVGGVLVLGVLLLMRRSAFAPSALRRDKHGAALVFMLVATAAEADIIMSAPALNATLKTMEKLTRQVKQGVPNERREALFQLGAEADGLAAIMNLEVESHGMQERELLDLALSRTKELGVGIAYNREKKKFFYDGAAFADYLKEAPRGAHAAPAEFKLLSYRFYQSSATDIAALREAAGAKARFLSRYPRFGANAEMRLYLAVDYRDLYRRHVEAHDAANAAKYRRLARAECLRITRDYPRSEQADAARQVLKGLAR
jgi:hypothetical protein